MHLAVQRKDVADGVHRECVWPEEDTAVASYTGKNFFMITGTVYLISFFCLEGKYLERK